MNEMADTLNYIKSNEMADTLNDHDTKTNPYLSSKLSFGGKEPEQAWNLQSNQMQFSKIVLSSIPCSQEILWGPPLLQKSSPSALHYSYRGLL